MLMESQAHSPMILDQVRNVMRVHHYSIHHTFRHSFLMRLLRLLQRRRGSSAPTLAPVVVNQTQRQRPDGLALIPGSAPVPQRETPLPVHAITAAMGEKCGREFNSVARFESLPAEQFRRQFQGGDVAGVHVDAG